MKNDVLAIFAHPDDAEFMCAGTLSLLQKAGWSVHIATMTPGDKGSAVLAADEISSIRRQEAARSAAILNASYHCLELSDIYIIYDRDSINRTTELIREIKPGIVLTASPDDYMMDHEVTSLIVQTACFAAGIKNMDVSNDPFEPVPYLYYSDPMEGRDKFGRMVVPGFLIDISGEMDKKEEMLKCHASQREWLLAHHKIDEYIISMKIFAESRGKEIRTKYAEAFRQHLGHSFPLDNILRTVLGGLVKVIN